MRESELDRNVVPEQRVPEKDMENCGNYWLQGPCLVRIILGDLKRIRKVCALGI